MLKKSITYTNFLDETVTEDFEFHISKAEFAKMELSAKGNSMTAYLKAIAKSQSGKEILETMESIVDKSYGVRSIDGKRFEKTPEALLAFKSCGAYDVLFEEMLLSDNATMNVLTFIRGVFPADMAEGMPTNEAELEAEMAKQSSSSVPEGVRMPTDRQPKAAQTPTPSPQTVVPFDGEVVTPTEKDTISAMSDEDFRKRIVGKEPHMLSHVEMVEVIKRGIKL